MDGDAEGGHECRDTGWMGGPLRAPGEPGRRLDSLRGGGGGWGAGAALFQK